MSWSDSRTVSLDGFASAGSFTPPVTLDSYDGRPRIRSATVFNQSNADCGIYSQIPGGSPRFVCPAGQFLVAPIDPTDRVSFAWAKVAGGQQKGSCYVAVTEEQLAAAAGAAPPTGGGVFVLDTSNLDGPDALT